MTSRLQQLHRQGQAVWLDFVDRPLLASGSLKRLIARGDVTGVTSNPTIFEQAMAKGGAYEESLASFLGQIGASAVQIYEAQAIADITAAAAELRDDLIAREAALEHLADRCVEAVDPAPKYAVPDVDALGPVPGSPSELAAYRSRLGRVADAMNLAHASYAAALAAHDDLTNRLDALRLKASAQGLASDRDLAAAEASAREVLTRQPCPVDVAKALVDAYDAWLTYAQQHDRGRTPKEARR